MSVGKNQNIYNINNPTKTKATKFAKKRSVLHSAISQRKNASQIPTTHNGGNKAAAIATPASVSERRVYHKASIAITHHDNAINKSINVGEVLAITCDVTEENGTSQVTNHAIITVITILKIRLFNDLTYIILCPLLTANVKDCIG